MGRATPRRAAVLGTRDRPRHRSAHPGPPTNATGVGSNADADPQVGKENESAAGGTQELPKKLIAHRVAIVVTPLARCSSQGTGAGAFGVRTSPGPPWPGRSRPECTAVTTCNLTDLVDLPLPSASAATPRRGRRVRSNPVPVRFLSSRQLRCPQGVPRARAVRAPACGESPACQECCNEGRCQGRPVVAVRPARGCGMLPRPTGARPRRALVNQPGGPEDSGIIRRLSHCCAITAAGRGWRA